MVKYLKRGNEVRELEELQIICDKDSPQTLNQEILIKAVYSGKEKIEYKFKSGTDYTVVFDGTLGNNMYEWENICKTLEEFILQIDQKNVNN